MQITIFDLLWLTLIQATFIWIARSLSSNFWVQALVWLLLTTAAMVLFIKYFVEREPRKK